MPENAFERFRRLRGVPQTDGAGVQTPPTEDTAPMSPLALLQALHVCGVRLIPYPDGTLRYEGETGTLPEWSKYPKQLVTYGSRSRVTPKGGPLR